MLSPKPLKTVVIERTKDGRPAPIRITTDDTSKANIDRILDHVRKIEAEATPSQPTPCQQQQAKAAPAAATGVGPNFNATREQFQAIEKCVARYTDIVGAASFDQLTLRMDLTACTTAGVLDPEFLYKAPLADFLHDIGGIERHIDRRTGALRDCFYPRNAPLPEGGA